MSQGLAISKRVLLSPQLSSGSGIAISAGSSTTIDSTQISAGKKGKLYAVRVACSVAVKVVLQTVLNGVATNVETFIANDWETPGPDFVTATQDPTAGLDGFRVVVTNLDVSLPADIYATFFWDEV